MVFDGSDDDDDEEHNGGGGCSADLPNDDRSSDGDGDGDEREHRGVKIMTAESSRWRPERTHNRAHQCAVAFPGLNAKAAEDDEGWPEPLYGAPQLAVPWPHRTRTSEGGSDSEDGSDSGRHGHRDILTTKPVIRTVIEIAGGGSDDDDSDVDMEVCT